MTKLRTELLCDVATQILAAATPSITRVAIDGVDGVGKTMFADELAVMLKRLDQTVIRASVDAFHNPRAVRYQRGRTSPEGFFLDSYNYPLLQETLLDPLSPGGTGCFRRGMFDHRTDSSAPLPEEIALPRSFLLFDGIFLHRPELRNYWDFSIFLEAAFSITVHRGAMRDNGSPDPLAPENRRYVEGQQLYLASCQPQRFASITINNEDLAAPFIISLTSS
ncbi:MAG: uridine kinase [Chlorobi bacterium CHB2]|nr:uridine kinase [Chlorobi bacterium CHB2]